MPIPIIVNNFMDHYKEQTEKSVARKRRKKLLDLKTKNSPRPSRSQEKCSELFLGLQLGKENSATTYNENTLNKSTHI